MRTQQAVHAGRVDSFARWMGEVLGRLSRGSDLLIHAISARLHFSWTRNASDVPFMAAAAPVRILDPLIANPVGEEETKMRSHVDVETVEIVDRLMEERDEILAKIETVPEAPEVDAHASIAILEGWADGLIEDDYVSAYMAEYKGCHVCEENYRFYKTLREENTEELR